MKSKLTSFLLILIIILLCVLGVIIYNEINSNSIVNEVQEFVSNITISTISTDENRSNSEVIESVINLSESTNKNVNDNDTQTYKYFYNQLEDYSKIIYDEIEKNKENMKTGTYEINLGTKFSSLLSKNNGEEELRKYYQSVIESYTYDNPDIFYIDFGKIYLNIETTTKGKNTTYKVFLNSGDNDNYLTDEFSSKEEIDNALNDIEKVKYYFIQNKKENTYENIKMVHDYLIESIEYDENTSYSYNIYGALVNKKCVCEGYAKSFKYLMDALDIPCTIIIGEATNSQGDTEKHAWNYVKLNEVWYAVDCTWDDPIIVGPGFLSNSSKYKYFLKGESELNKTHIPNGQFTENGKVFTFPTLNINNY
ncbi:MAG: hypothetical protein IJE05_02645 [Clostridia bacterium]|nr:hypothetical protein [Clostridia bacterium]